MTYFKIALSKRGVTCSQCKSLVEKGMKYFVYFHFEKDKTPYPVQDKFCMECAKEVINPEFLSYLKQLTMTVQRNLFTTKV